jgi:hypothetical protein
LACEYLHPVATEPLDSDRGTGKGGPEAGAVGALVLGPGRSGTSAIARAFVAAGFFAGRDDELHGPAASNPFGHFESLAVMKVNEDLLARFECSWWADAPPVEEQLPHRAEAVPRLRAVLDALISSAGGSPVVLKEPRINSLLPLWLPAIEGVLHPVLVLRDPLEIALSHGSMDGTSAVHALAAWEAQMTTVLQQLEGAEVTIAPYDQLTARPETAVEIVAGASDRLAGSLAALVRPAAAPAAVQSELRNQNAAGLVHSDYMTARQLLLWEYLGSLPGGQARLALPSELGALSSAARETMRKESERVRLVEAHARLVAELAPAEDRRIALERRLEEANERLAEVTALAQREAAGAAAMRESSSWKLTAPLRRLKRPRGP